MKCEEFVWGFEVCGVLGFFYGVASTVPDAVTKLAATFANPFAILIKELLNLSSVAHIRLLLH